MEVIFQDLDYSQRGLKIKSLIQTTDDQDGLLFDGRPVDGESSIEVLVYFQVLVKVSKIGYLVN